MTLRVLPLTHTGSNLPVALDVLERISRICAIETFGFADLASPSDSFRAILRNTDYSTRHLAIAVEDGEAHAGVPPPPQLTRGDFLVGEGTCVGYGWISLPTSDNTHSAHMWLQVLPAYRRRGAGRQLARHLLGLATQAGRSVVTSWSDHPAGGTTPPLASPIPESAGGHTAEPDPDVLFSATGSRTISIAEPAVEFARSFGAELEQIEERSLLRLMPSFIARLAHRVDRAAADVDAQAPGEYSLIQWGGPAPGSLVNELAQLYARMSVDLPSAGLEIEEQAWDSARIRAREKSLAATDWTSIMTAVHHRDGQLVAYTEFHAKPGPFATQEDTFVHGDHRGNRLGAWVKAANLANLLSEFPSVERIHTWNASENDHMLAINRELGFAVDGLSAVWQLRLKR